MDIEVRFPPKHQHKQNIMSKSTKASLWLFNSLELPVQSFFFTVFLFSFFFFFFLCM